MKVLLVSEGKHELAGALETLVRRLFSPREIEIDHDKVSIADVHAYHGKGQGYTKRAIRWLLDARKRGYDAIVLVIDEDGQTERVREIAEAQKHEGFEFQRAFGVAIRTFDAWMLADEQALTAVLGCQIQCQPAPESEKDPKQACKDLRDAGEADISQTEMYVRIAERVNLLLLEQRCPRGFAPFADRVRRL